MKVGGLILYYCCDGATAYDQISVVEDDSLTGGDGSLRFVEDNTAVTVLFRVDRCRLLNHPGAGLGFHADG